MTGHFTRRDFYCRLMIGAVTLILLLGSCKHEKTVVTPVRTYRMGFENFAPNANTYLQSLALWTQRADAAIIGMQVPWDTLYSGTTPEKYITNNYVALVNYYRSKNLKLWVYIDPANGLDRSADASDLAALGKSISQPDVQALYGKFVFVMDSLLKPEHLGLALETNAIRGTSSGAIYQGIKAATNSTAALVRAYDKNVKLSVSIQADYAWGLLNSGPFLGIEQDFTDFPFIQELGISSYPYFVYNTPQDIPSNYYSKLIQGHSVPVFISEGGWSTVTVSTYTENTQKQADYITKQGQLLDGVNAIGYFQLTFTDLSTAELQSTINSDINLFTHLGLVDTNLVAKPALKTWDQVFSRPLAPGH
jgi:hypothetical protein